MSNKGLVITLIILLMVFGIAVVATSNDNLLGKFNFLKSTKEEPKVTVVLPTAQASKISVEDMKKLAMGPVANPKEADLKKYSESVNNASVMSNVLDISSCNPTPNVLSFDAARPLTFVNKDTVPHEISISVAGNSMVLAKVNGGSQIMTVVSSLKSGIYSYVCDSEGPAGMFLVQ